MWRLTVVALGLFLLGSTCEEQPCDRYIDYMCDCHADDPEFSCQELRSILEDASPDVQEQCEIDLASQQADDDDAGLECDGGDSSVF